MIKRATIFVDHPDEGEPPELRWVIDWLKRWKQQVIVADYSTGGWELLWDVEGPEEAIGEIPGELRCGSEWANSHPESEKYFPTT
jgi:hypothetical protein